jgi:hypothetical protein
VTVPTDPVAATPVKATALEEVTLPTLPVATSPVSACAETTLPAEPIAAYVSTPHAPDPQAFDPHPAVFRLVVNLGATVPTLPVEVTPVKVTFLSCVSVPTLPDALTPVNATLVTELARDENGAWANADIPNMVYGLRRLRIKL